MIKIPKVVTEFFTRKHRHKHTEPIVSMYISFSTRDIIYECTCGHREVRRESFGFSEPFPIQTAMNITNKEFLAMLNNQV